MEKISFYYLFGKDAVDQYNNYIGTAEDFLNHLEENNTDFDTFKFVYGMTTPSELLMAYDGWEGYHPIPEEFYHALQMKRVLSWEQAKNQVHDASATENPESVLWYRGEMNIYYPLF